MPCGDHDRLANLVFHDPGDCWRRCEARRARAQSRGDAERGGFQPQHSARWSGAAVTGRPLRVFEIEEISRRSARGRENVATARAHWRCRRALARRRRADVVGRAPQSGRSRLGSSDLVDWRSDLRSRAAATRAAMARCVRPERFRRRRGLPLRHRMSSSRRRLRDDGVAIRGRSTGDAAAPVGDLEHARRAAAYRARRAARGQPHDTPPASRIGLVERRIASSGRRRRPARALALRTSLSPAQRRLCRTPCGRVEQAFEPRWCGEIYHRATPGNAAPCFPGN